MFKIKVKFIHLCILAIVFLISNILLYKYVRDLKNNNEVIKKTIENIFTKINTIEKSVISQTLNNESKVFSSQNQNQEIEKLYTDIELNKESDIKSKEYQDLLNHMSNLVDIEEMSNEDEEDEEDDENEILEEIDGEEYEEDEEEDEEEEDEEENEEDEEKIVELEEEVKYDEGYENELKEYAKQDDIEFNSLEKEEEDEEDIKINLKATNNDLNLKTVNELKEILKLKNISCKGNKKQLIEKILSVK